MAHIGELLARCRRRLKLHNIPLWVHAWSWGIFLFSVLALAVTFYVWRDMDVWDGWRESSELRKLGYAETKHVESVFRTRANTWSNLVYVFVGLYTLFWSIRDFRISWSPRDGYLVNTPAMGVLLGMSCCYLGIGSGIFHASLTRWGQQLDVAAMYSPLVVLIGLNAARWFPRLPGRAKRPTWPLLAAVVIVVSALLYVYKWEMSSYKVLPGLILAVFAFAVLDLFSRRKNPSFWWVAVASIALVAAVVCRQLDVAHRFSSPDSPLQGHSFWHLFTGCSLLSMYFYYRSEEITE